jgi:hypothetical protein
MTKTRKQNTKAKLPGFPGARAWEKAWQQWGQEMMQEGVFARDEIGFGYVTDSPAEAVNLMVRSLPGPVRQQLELAA